MQTYETVHGRLNAPYWDGLLPGFDSAPVLECPVPDRTARGFARNVFSEFTDKGGAYTPLYTYQTGEEFVADRYPSGTVVLFGRESLSVFNAIEYDTDVIATRPTELNPQVGPLTPVGLHYHDANLLYLYSNYYGVIAERKNGVKCLATILTSTAFARNFGNSEPTTLTIGQTYRRAGQYNGATGGYTRINRLEIAGYGIHQKQRARLRRLSSVLVSRPTTI